MGRSMNYEETYEELLKDPDVLQHFDEKNVQFDPVTGLLADEDFGLFMKGIKEEMDGYPAELKAEPYQMYRRFLAYFGMCYDYICNMPILSSAGKDRIVLWHKAVDEYSALSNGSYPLVCSVTKPYAHLVKHLLPQEYIDVIDQPDRYVLTAMRYMPSEFEVEAYVTYAKRERKAAEIGENEISFDGCVTDAILRGGVVPAGVLSFLVDKEGDDTIIRIEWLYVAKEHRNHHMADALLAEMLYMVSAFNVEAVLFDVEPTLLAEEGEPHLFEEPTRPFFHSPTENEDEFSPDDTFAPIVYFFTKWQFIGGMFRGGQVIARLSDFKINKRVVARINGISGLVALASVSPIEFKRFTQEMINKYPGKFERSIPFAGMSRYDKDISCYYNNGLVKGILLAHVGWDGRIVIDMVAGKNFPTDGLRILYLFFAKEAMKKYPLDTRVFIRVWSKKDSKQIEKMLSEVRYLLQVRLALLAPDIDVTTDDIIKFCAENRS